jgi:hypothetical protein
MARGLLDIIPELVRDKSVRRARRAPSLPDGTMTPDGTHAAADADADADAEHACRRPALGMLASGAVVFGVQRLVPTYDNSWYKQLAKPGCARGLRVGSV